MASFSELSELVTPLEEFIKELHHHRIFVDEDIVHLVEDAAEYFRAILGRMTGDELVELQGLPLFRARLSELREKAIGHLLRGAGSDNDGKDFSAVKRLMAEGLLALQDYPVLYDYLEHQTAPPRVVFNQLLADLKTIQEQLIDADIAPILELSGLMAPIYSLLLELGTVPSQDVINSLKQNHEDLLNLFDMLAADQDLCSISAADKDRLTIIETQLREQLSEHIALIESSQGQMPEPVDSEIASVETVVEDSINAVAIEEEQVEELSNQETSNQEPSTDRLRRP
jgi:chemosensory pili system protein ChpA (sensor histidine kinase/response regulator)